VGHLLDLFLRNVSSRASRVFLGSLLGIIVGSTDISAHHCFCDLSDNPVVKLIPQAVGVVLDVGVVVTCSICATVDSHCMEAVRVCLNLIILAPSVNDIKSAGVDHHRNGNSVAKLDTTIKLFSEKVEVEDFWDFAEPPDVLLVSKVALVVSCVGHYSSLLMVIPDLVEVCLEFVGNCQIDIKEG